MSIYSYYDNETGVFAPCRNAIPDSDTPERFCPGGHSVFKGFADHTRVRFDKALGGLVPYQPPSPPANEWEAWTWNVEAWQWVSVPTEAALTRDARAERTRRLAACDWTQLADVPAATSQAWEGYRQALRDVTGQSGFPLTINWPQEPA
jgi:Phage tail assembly chaperone protein